MTRPIAVTDDAITTAARDARSFIAGARAIALQLDAGDPNAAPGHAADCLTAAMGRLDELEDLAHDLARRARQG